MKRALQDLLIDELSKHVLGGAFAEGDTVHVEAAGEALKFGKAAVKDAKPVGSLSAGAGWQLAPQPSKGGAGPKGGGKKGGDREQQVAELTKATKDVEAAVRAVKE
jgi:hypothetical protein